PGGGRVPARIPVADAIAGACRPAAELRVPLVSRERDRRSQPAQQYSVMIVLLGGSGYIGQAFAQALRERQQAFIALTRKELDYTRYDLLLKLLRETKPSF